MERTHALSIAGKGPLVPIAMMMMTERDRGGKKGTGAVRNAVKKRCCWGCR